MGQVNTILRNANKIKSATIKLCEDVWEKWNLFHQLVHKDANIAPQSIL